MDSLSSWGPLEAHICDEQSKPCVPDGLIHRQEVLLFFSFLFSPYASMALFGSIRVYLLGVSMVGWGVDVALEFVQGMALRG